MAEWGLLKTLKRENGKDRNDLVDEAEAFIAGFDAQPLDPAQKGSEFLNAIDIAKRSGVNAVVEVLARKGHYARYPKNDIRITNITPTIYAVPRNK